MKALKQKIRMALGEIPAGLALKNANIVNVFTGELEYGDIAISGDMIVGVGSYAGEHEIDLAGKTVCPGFIDGHIHIESAMLPPGEFASAVVRHGTTTVVSDPHEIANVCGKNGIDYMLAASENLPVDIYFMLPSCVPATPLDETGATLSAADLLPYYEHPRVLGLAEVMNYPGLLACDETVLQKLLDAQNRNALIDGHAPFVTGNAQNAYIAAGVLSDHECTSFDEARERIARGQWIMIREGTAAHNLKALTGLFDPCYSHRCMLVTDDRHPGELLRDGHIDYIIKKAAEYGANPVTAIQMATVNAAAYFGLKRRGAVAPGYRADLVVLDNLERFSVLDVYKNGRLVVENKTVKEFNLPSINPELKRIVTQSFHLAPLVPENFAITGQGENRRAISLVDNELLTEEWVSGYKKSGTNGVDIENDIIKLAVIERCKNTGHIGLGYLRGYGLRQGAVASSVAHDSHNIIVAGTNNADMAAAANYIRESQGGWAIAVNGEILGGMPLPVAGLMSERTAEEMDAEIRRMKSLAESLGVNGRLDAFMTLSFLSLPVIPSLKITTHGLVDVARQEIVKTIF